ncbi:MAG: hypothetical protein ACO331_10200 [Prochlorothrix sp.]
MSVRRQTAQGHLWFILSWPGTLMRSPRSPAVLPGVFLAIAPPSP